MDGQSLLVPDLWSTRACFQGDKDDVSDSANNNTDREFSHFWVEAETPRNASAPADVRRRADPQWWGSLSSAWINSGTHRSFYCALPTQATITTRSLLWLDENIDFYFVKKQSQTSNVSKVTWLTIFPPAGICQLQISVDLGKTEALCLFLTFRASWLLAPHDFHVFGVFSACVNLWIIMWNGPEGSSASDGLPLLSPTH